MASRSCLRCSFCARILFAYVSAPKVVSGTGRRTVWSACRRAPRSAGTPFRRTSLLAAVVGLVAPLPVDVLASRRRPAAGGVAVLVGAGSVALLGVDWVSLVGIHVEVDSTGQTAPIRLLVASPSAPVRVVRAVLS